MYNITNSNNNTAFGFYSIYSKNGANYNVAFGHQSGLNLDNSQCSVFGYQSSLYSKYKDKLIILDNASSHRNDKIRELVNKNNKLLYAVPYQHFTNSIENYFSMMKARLRKI